MKLLSMTVRRTFPEGVLGVTPRPPLVITFPTLVDGTEDIYALARNGVDPVGDQILSMDIECSDGLARTYSPRVLAELSRV